MRGRNWLRMLVLAMLALALVAGGAPALADEVSDLSEGAVAEEAVAPEEEADDTVEEGANEGLAPDPDEAVGAEEALGDEPVGPVADEGAPLGVTVDEDEPLSVGSYGVNENHIGYTSASGNRFSYPQCTWYAWGRAYEKCGVSLTVSGNAQNWLASAQANNWRYGTGSTPRANSIVVWEGLGSANSGIGHVAFVERVSGSTIYFSESNHINSSLWGKYNETSCNGTVGSLQYSGTAYATRLIGYIYLEGSNPSVNFSPWENGSYTFVSEGNAAIGQQIDVSGGTATDSGMVLYDNSRNKLAQASNGSFYYRIYFNINQELGYTLTPATTYQYRFWVVVNGTTYWSGYQSFKTIGTRDIGQATVSSVADQTWTGSAITPSPTVKWGGTTLTKGTDYTLSYSNNVNVGTATITVTGKGDYSGTKSVTFNITGPAEMTTGYDRVLPDGNYQVFFLDTEAGFFLDIEGTDFPAASNTKVLTQWDSQYDTSMINYWNLTYRNGFYTITQVGTDMALEVADSSNEAGAIVQVNPSDGGSNQEWAISIIDSDKWGITYYRIENKCNGYSLGIPDGYSYDDAPVVVTIDSDSDSQRWCFSPASPKEITVSLGIEEQTWTGLPLTPSPTVRWSVIPLSEGTDYTLSYGNNVNVGMATITVTGMGDYSGTAKAGFRIVARDISQTTATPITDQAWTGSAVTPNPTIKWNDVALVEGTDYTLSYSNNVNVGTASITITGKGNFAGTMSAPFNIVRRDISQANVSPVADQAWSGSAITPNPTVRWGGATLAKGTDYALSYKNNVNAGTATITITGKGSYTGTKSVTFKINPAQVSSCTVTAPGAQAHTGSALTPKPTVTFRGVTLSEGTDYTLYYADNVNVGTATVTITGKGNFTGMTSATFQITAPTVQLIPIYRMYNTKTSEHLWTKSKAEYNACGSGSYKDWRQEGVAWYSPSLKAPSDIFSGTQGDYVYVWRLYDRGRTGDHIYLVAGPEMSDYLSDGWVVDKGAGFWTVRKGTTISGRTTIPIYRAYNYRLGRGKHHYTPSKVEYDKICKNNGWAPEGTKFYVIKK